jgi:hypothetical protein
VQTLAWHFLSDDGKTRDGIKVTPGQTLQVEPPLRMCEHGLHASVRAIDALRYAPGAIVCRVEVSGDVLFDYDKCAGSKRKVIWMADATRALHEFACRIAEGVLNNMQDERSRNAIAVKRKWVDCNATDDELRAARIALWEDTEEDAYLDIARANARANARATARAATANAAWEAARDAAWQAARATSMESEQVSAKDTQNKMLEQMLLELVVERS